MYIIVPIVLLIPFSRVACVSVIRLDQSAFSSPFHYAPRSSWPCLSFCVRLVFPEIFIETETEYQVLEARPLSDRSRFDHESHDERDHISLLSMLDAFLDSNISPSAPTFPCNSYPNAEMACEKPSAISGHIQRFSLPLEACSPHPIFIPSSLPACTHVRRRDRLCRR